MALTQVPNSMVAFDGGSFSFRNKIINGDMRIDQRNAGASVTPSTTGAFVYTLDRWSLFATQASKFSLQRNAGAVTPPDGYSNYIGVTSASAYTSLSTDQFILTQQVEGYNMVDLAWGGSNAKTVTLSFWVRSSLTGQFSATLENLAGTRSYVATYTINQANTWEQKTITIPGATSGVWNTDNTIGMYVIWNLGDGSTFQTTPNTWYSGGANAATGDVKLVGTSGATFYLTGVQLEVGTAATPFERRPYGTEFQLCQRYYEQWSLASTQYVSNGFAYSATDVRTVFQFEVPKRAAVSPSFSGSVNFANSGKSATITSFSFDGASAISVLMYNSSQSGFTTGQALQVQVTSSQTATLSFSAEL